MTVQKDRKQIDYIHRIYITVDRIENREDLAYQIAILARGFI